MEQYNNKKLIFNDMGKLLFTFLTKQEEACNFFLRL